MFLPVAILSIGWIVSISVHEFGHAVIAYWGGDTSVKEKGYLACNPTKFANPLLSLVVPIVLLLVVGIPLSGQANYINYQQLRGRGWHSAVAAAGPASNLMLALMLALPFRLQWISSATHPMLWSVVACLIVLNLCLAMLNLLPIPPLDGYGVIEPWLPPVVQSRFRGLRRLGLWVLVGLLWSNYQIYWMFMQPSLEAARWMNVPLLPLVGHYCRLDPEILTFSLLAALLLMGACWMIRVICCPVVLLDLVGFGWLLARQPCQALACFERVLQTQPTSYTSWLNRGNALSQLHRYEEAIAAYEQAIHLKPRYYNPLFRQGTHQAWLNRGNALYNLKRYQEALASYNQAIQLQPQNPLLWYNKGVALSHWGWQENALARLSEALTAYAQAIHLKPNYYQAWYNRGIILSQLGNHEAALTAFETVLKLQPTFAPAWLNQGLLLTDLQRSHQALHAFKQLIQLQPDHYLSWHHWGNGLTLVGRYEEAISAYNQAIQLQPNHADTWYKKACCYLHQNQKELAIDLLQTAFRLNPELREYARTDGALESIYPYL